jgi:prepilin-type N-terminal cleavage/methylation domain-containing protein
MNKNKNTNISNNKAFSLIELSIVILIIGILVAGVTSSSRLVKQMKLTSARSLTIGSPIASISNLLLWTETTLESSFDKNISNNDKVIIWNDINPQSTYKSNFSQSNATYQPQYVDSGINGLPSVYFNNFNLLSPSFVIGANYGIFIVFNSAGINVNGSTILNVTDGLNHGINIEIQPSTGAYLGLNRRIRALHRSPLGTSTENDNYANATYAIQDNANYVFAYTRNVNTNKSFFYINGNNANDPSFTGATTQALNGNNLTLMIGNLLPNNFARPFVGKISEIIIYDKTLNTEELTAVNSYLLKKFNIK